jgi:beta-carotene hydroxylase
VFTHDFPDNNGIIPAVNESLPTLNELGRDLLEVPRLPVYLSLIFPFVLTFGFFSFGLLEWWPMALLCPVLLSFFTYASISHDLVHRTLGLPKPLNEALLCAVELLALRSGHAYRASHFHHHATFPAEDDLEGAASGMSFFQALMDGFTLQFRIWRNALRTSKADHTWVVGEGIGIMALLSFSLLLVPWTILPVLYCGFVIAGSWIYPFMTSWVPHDARGKSELTQTRLFRGQVVRFLALEHLYHLEHHLYPQVPHHRWPDLAKRLDPYFDKIGLTATKLWF